MFFREGDYFKEKAGIWASIIPDKIKHEAAIALSFQPFPITKWNDSEITDDHIFDALEFLYDHVSKPGDRGQVMNHDGYTYSDYWSTTKLLERQSFVRKQTGSFAIMDQDMN
jgi:hypothetical protein